MGPDAPSKRIKWDRSRDTILLIQVISMGVKAFTTNKANTKETAEKDKYSSTTRVRRGRASTYRPDPKDETLKTSLKLKTERGFSGSMLLKQN